MSGADPSKSLTPRNPSFLLKPSDSFDRTGAMGLNLHEDDPEPSRFYAVSGDIFDLTSGTTSTVTLNGVSNTLYNAAKPVWMQAGRDLVNVEGTILNNNVDDVSILSAGRDIIHANFQIAGPGVLSVSAGRNINQEDQASLTSIGPVVAGDTRPGASVFMEAGVGSAGPNYAALGKLYLKPDNAADPSKPLADQPGKVAKTYDQELYAWVQQNEGTKFSKWLQNPDNASETDSPSGAYAFFQTLTREQQGVFLRQVYFTELQVGGREFNDVSSPRHGSYLRGRQAITMLFPQTDASGHPITYSGDITMFGGSGVHTNLGGDIQMFAPGGQIIVGVEGTVPPASAGLITLGPGNIQMYSKGSILLGLSRIMATFGGDVLAWSAEGDINAGRGAKSTIGYQSPRRVYDSYGMVSLSPSAPSSGAGISARSAVPGVQSGNVDLIAPLGTIDVGEAGVSGFNVNLAALHIVNAANISAQGTTTGVPTIQAPNIGGLTEASNTAGAAAQQASLPKQGSGNAQPSIIIVEVLGFGGGDGTGTPSNEDPRQKRSDNNQGQDPGSAVQVIGAGTLSPDQRSKLTSVELRNFDSP